MTTPEKNKWITPITVFIMIFVSIETLIFGTNENGLVELIGYGILFLLTFFYISRSFFGGTVIPLNTKVLFLIFINLFALALNGDFTIKYLYSAMLIILAYLVSKTIPLNEFLAAFRLIINIFAIASLIGVILHEFVPSLVSYLPITTNTNGYNYYNLFLTLIPQDRLWVYFRSYGVFREPGIFAFYLNLALLFELFDKEKAPRYSYLISYLAALIFTYSTAGYVVAGIIMVVYLFKKTESNKQRNIKLLILFVIIIALAVVFSSDHFYNRILSKTETENNSSTSRLASIFLNLKLAFRDPLHAFFGNGYTYTDSNFVLLGKELYQASLHNTNTVLKMLSVYGVGYVLVFLVGISKFLHKISDGLFCCLGLLIAIFLLLSNEDIVLNVLLYVFIFYGDTLHIPSPNNSSIIPIPSVERQNQ